MKTIVILSILFVHTLACEAQHFTFKQRTQLIAELSTHEVAHLGLRYRIKQSTLGINAGVVPPLSDRQYDASIGIAYAKHLWGSSKKTDLKPWFVKAGLSGISYSLRNTPRTYQRGDIVYARLHLGRDFNISPRFATNFSIGPAAQLYAKAHNDTFVREGFYLLRSVSFDMAVLFRLQKI